MTDPAGPPVADEHPEPDVLHELAAAGFPLPPDAGWAGAPDAEASPPQAHPAGPGELAPAAGLDLALIARHVAGCARCRAYLDDLAAVSLLLRSPALDAGPMPADVADRVAAALVAQRSARPAPDARPAATPAATPAGPQAGTAAATRAAAPSATPATPAAVASLADARRVRRSRWRAGLLAAAAVAAIGLLVPSVGGLLSGGGGDSAEDRAASQGSATEDTLAGVAPYPAAEAARALVAAAARESGSPPAPPGAAEGATPGAAPHAAPDATGGAAGDAVPGGTACGRTLAAELGGQVVGTTTFESDVLVVVRQPAGELEYLVVPACTSSAAEALSRGPVPD